MSRGDEESIDESKMPEAAVVGAGDSGGNDPMTFRTFSAAVMMMFMIGISSF